MLPSQICNSTMEILLMLFCSERVSCRHFFNSAKRRCGSINQHAASRKLTHQSFENVCILEGNCSQPWYFSCWPNILNALSTIQTCSFCSYKNQRLLA
ncbi:hypothetical protein PRUPE_6G333500 [Prunus persica]|uniref:Uncharacterized protein n=1 Tax=Prunus persica TaxID=3760 RepID=A0A251NZC8_PRUPE|nr:hypothetical protein PRUPE_6G333500 [Prunus persica]